MELNIYGNTISNSEPLFSCRSFNSEPIPEDKLEAILKAGMSAPVGMGVYNSMQLTVIQKKKLITKIGDAVIEAVTKMMGKPMDKHFGENVLVILSAAPTKMPGLEFANAGTVLENMAIAASRFGINSIIHGNVSIAAQNAEILKELNIPEGLKPVLGISLGYAKNPESPKEHTIAAVTRIK